MFFKGSRYANVETLEMTDTQGRVIRYKKTRFIADITTDMGHRVAAGERLDHIAYRYYRDPERFWRICDANRVMWPEELTEEPGTIVRIPPTID